MSQSSSWAEEGRQNTTYSQKRGAAPCFRTGSYSAQKGATLRTFISHTISEATNRVFDTNGLVTILNDEAMRNTRNKAAHDEVPSRDEAHKARSWTMQILRQV
jgi:hypothetical protein